MWWRSVWTPQPEASTPMAGWSGLRGFMALTGSHLCKHVAMLFSPTLPAAVLGLTVLPSSCYGPRVLSRSLSHSLGRPHPRLSVPRQQVSPLIILSTSRSGTLSVWAPRFPQSVGQSLAPRRCPTKIPPRTASDLQPPGWLCYPQ